jgi:predicted RNA binding protein YcfA (HicA-like mRNA interferase family)
LPRLPTLTAREAESRLLGAGFALVRSKGSHRIYLRGTTRMVLPFHAGRDLHPKIVKQVMAATEPESKD